MLETYSSLKKKYETLLRTMTNKKVDAATATRMLNYNEQLFYMNEEDFTIAQCNTLTRLFNKIVDQYNKNYVEE